MTQEPPSLHSLKSSLITATDVDSISERPSEGATPWLVIFSGPDVGRGIELPEGEILIGRRSRCDVTLTASTVSRQHARMKLDLEERHFEIADLDSKNGTYIDGEPVGDGAVFENGAKLRIGTETIAEFVLQDEEEDEYFRNLYHAATRDGLTDVYSRESIVQQMRQVSERMEDIAEPLWLALVDLDGFKKVNDRHGHPAGDSALLQLAEVLREVTNGREAMLGRYGGDEFILLFRSFDDLAPEAFLEELRQRVAEHGFTHEGTEFDLTISIGAASTDTTSSNQLKEVHYAADRALYQVKERGGDDCQIARPDSRDDNETLAPF